MATIDLSITVHLERLRAIKENDDFYFGLNLSTAFNTGEIPPWTGTHPDPEYQRLGPWKWTGLKPRVWLWKQGEPLAQAREVAGGELKVINGPDGKPDPEWKPSPALSDRLIAFVNHRTEKLPRFPSADAAEDPFYWNSGDTIGDGKRSEDFGYDETSDPDQTPQDFFKWAPFALSVSRLPAPIPQKLNLSHLVSVTQEQLEKADLDPQKDLFALFICLDTVIADAPTAFTTPPESLRTGLVWDNDPANDPELNAFKLVDANGNATVFIQPVVMNRAPSQEEPRMDLDRLWVKLDIDADGADWASQTIQNLTQSMDPAQHLVDVLRSLFEDTVRDPIALNEAAVFVPRAVLKLSRALAHCDSRVDGRSLVSRVANTLKIDPEKLATPVQTVDSDMENLLKGSLTEIGNAYEQWKNTPDKPKEWWTFLGKASSQLKGLLTSEAVLEKDPAVLLPALETFTAQLSDAATLNSLVTAQWKEACVAAAPMAGVPAWSDLAPALAVELAARNIRLTFQEQWMEKLLPDLVQFLEDKATFAEKARSRILEALEAIFPDPEFTKALKERSATLLLKLAQQASFEAQEDDSGKTRQAGVEDAHPVLFVVDRPRHVSKEKESVAADDDFQRRIAGVGLLLKKANTAEGWSCLNMARVRENPFEFGVANGATVQECVIKPSALTQLNGQRQVTLPYDNLLLGAKNPITDAAIHTQQQDADPSLQGWLGYEVPAMDDSQPDLKEYRVPALVFGQKYRAAAFLVANNGQLPWELIDSDYMKRKPFPLPAELDFPHAKDFVYQRRTRIGSPRLHGDKHEPSTSAARKALLPIPAGVRPLAGELPDPADSKKPLVGDRGPALLLIGEDKTENKIPGLKSEFRFGLRPPSVTHQVWERWQRKSPDKFDAAALGLMHAGILTLREVDSKADCSLDDPCLEQKFCVCVEQIHPRTTAPKYYPIDCARPAIPAEKKTWADFLNLLNSQHALPVEFKIAVGKDPGFNQDQRMLTVLPGEIWRLRVYAVAKKDCFGRKEEEKPISHFVKDPAMPVLNAALDGADNNGPFYAFEPFDVVVESATDALPSAQDLWQALRPGFETKKVGGKDSNGKTIPQPCEDLVVRLDKDLIKQPSWANVGTIELQRQRWKWHGRPTGTPPLPVQDNVENRIWDLYAYTLRDDEDHVVENVPLTYDSVVRPAHRELKRLPLTDDSRCLHFRWSMKAISRYAPTIAQQAETTDAEKNFDRWKRVLVECRPRPEPVAVPALKLILPITDSWQDDQVSSSPGVLCVFHDEWYEKHGLAEALVAGIRAVQDPKTQNWYLQYGDDPVLNTHALKPIDSSRLELVANNSASDPAKPATEGVFPLDQQGLLHRDTAISPPMGHTFDRLSTTKPRLLHSSFVLRMPTIPQEHFQEGSSAENESPAGWRFVQLRFKRRLLPDLCRNGGVKHESEWTSPQWVQLLHSRTALLPEGGLDLLQPDSTKIEITLKAGGAGWQLWRGGQTLGVPRIFAHRNAASGADRFACWLVLTTPIFDVSGQPSESYFATLQMDSATPPAYFSKKSLPRDFIRGETLIARWVEIQTRNTSDLAHYIANVPGGDPWLALFPAESKQDAVARITNVSPRVKLRVE